jgi:serine/threonine protein kinase/molecular chaperone DnaK (HSP70)
MNRRFTREFATDRQSTDAYNKPSGLAPNLVLLFGVPSYRSRLTDTDYNYPTADEPTREFSDDGSDSLSFSSTGTFGGEVPKKIGDYEIRELIGQGGMGQVFLAEHTRMQRIVAIKMLPIERMADEAAIGRFYDEVRAASRLMHPNIVTAFDAGDADGVHYLAMEYVDGQTLTEIVAKKGPMSVGEAAAIIRQAALGLLHAHRAGIVHRDVKPGNIMRAVDGTVKVLDLGLARINSVDLETANGAPGLEGAGDKKRRGRLTGTLPFISPEQLEDSETADPRSDIYSLGATMYFLLTGRPPYTGEFLDLIYGHRHGEIPDLMQARADVDMRFANIFNRMMAKSPDQRYASLDEVIDELGEYASKTDAPVWLSEFTQQQTGAEHSTTIGGSTLGATARILAIDFGMFYSAAAEASPTAGIRILCAGGEDRTIFRMAVTSEDQKLIYGGKAMELRADQAFNVVHCLPMYIGKSVVEREIAGRQCPPEVLMAMMFRRIRQNAWPAEPLPHATAITIPASYDQLHRQSVLQAAQMAGLKSVRLVDRSIACVQSLLIEGYMESLDDDSTSLESSNAQTILFVGVTGQATEVAVIRRDSARLSQLSTAGHWHTGTLPWLHRLVDLTAREFVRLHNFDPRKRSKTAASLQMACERAMNSMLLLSSVRIKIQVRDQEKTVTIQRRNWLQACEDLASRVRATIKSACRDASVSLKNIDVCVTLGPLLRIASIRDAVLRGHSENLKIHPMDRADAARGAAACLAAELPGRREGAMPPRGVATQSIGIVVNDAKGRRRILPIIPKGTLLPARANRRLTVGTDRESMTLSLVESSGVEGDHWQSLGRHDFQVGESIVRTRMIGFEVNVNGMLTVRAQTPGKPGSSKLPPLPIPVLSEEKIAQWTKWLDSLG